MGECQNEKLKLWLCRGADFWVKLNERVQKYKAFVKNHISVAVMVGGPTERTTNTTHCCTAVFKLDFLLKYHYPSTLW